MKHGLMTFWLVCLVSLLSGPLALADDTHKLQPIKQAPAGLAPQIATTLQDQGYRVTGPEGIVCEIWLVKQLALKPNFKPRLDIAYPFTSGQLMGAIRFPKGTLGKDFRGQELPAGFYTLRYAQQPEDGNHLGTSEIRDFCLALPASADSDPKRIAKIDDLNERSAEAAGSPHPAIFLLTAPAEQPLKSARLIYDEEQDYWVVAINGRGKMGDKSVPVPVYFVAVGLGE